MTGEAEQETRGVWKKQYYSLSENNSLDQPFSQAPFNWGRVVGREGGERFE